MNLGELFQSKNKNYFYLMHLSYGYDLEERERLWNYAVKENLIGLDLPDKVKEDWNTLTEKKQKVAERVWIQQFNIFCNDMSIGDYVVVPNGQLYLLGIGTISEKKYWFDKNLSGIEENGFFDHLRKVKWITTHDYKGVLLPEQLSGFDRTLLKVTSQSRYWEILTGIHT